MLDYKAYLRRFVEDYTDALSSFNSRRYNSFFRNYRPAIENLATAVLATLLPDDVEGFANGSKNLIRDNTGKWVVLTSPAPKNRSAKFLIDIARKAMDIWIKEHVRDSRVRTQMTLATDTIQRDYSFASNICHATTEAVSNMQLSESLVSECIVGTRNIIDHVRIYFPDEGREILDSCPTFTVKVNVLFPEDKDFGQIETYASATVSVLPIPERHEVAKPAIRPANEQGDNISEAEAEEEVERHEEVKVVSHLAGIDESSGHPILDARYPGIDEEYDIKNVEANINISTVDTDDNVKKMIESNLRTYKRYLGSDREKQRKLRAEAAAQKLAQSAAAAEIEDDEDSDDSYSRDDSNHGVFYAHDEYTKRKYHYKFKGEVVAENGYRYQVPNNENAELYDEAEVCFDIATEPHINPAKKYFYKAVNVEIIA